MTKVLFDYQIFSHQIYGGISRYFANIHDVIKQVPDIESSISILYSKNFYIKDDPGLLGPFMGKLMLPSPRKIIKWNKKYSTDTIRRGDFDLLHPTYYDPYFIEHTKRPFIITVHDMIHELYPQYFLPDDRTAQDKKLCVENAAHIIAISQTTKNDLMSILGVEESRISVVHHGYTSQLFSTEAGAPNTYGKYILYVGERKGYKNFAPLLPVFANLINSHHDLSMICVGGGHFVPEEIEEISQLGLEDKILQLNTSDGELSQLYKHAEAFVYPSLYEGFGLPLLEAFQNSCPVVAANNPCLKEIGEDAVIYFDTDNPDSLSEILCNLIDNTRLKKKLVELGVKQLQKFTMEKCASKTLNIYREYS